MFYIKVPFSKFNKLLIKHSLVKNANRLMCSAKNVVIVDGARTPFCKSSTKFIDINPMTLVYSAVESIINRTKIKPQLIQYLILGNALQSISYTNMARDGINALPFLRHIPGHSINAACISSLIAATSAFDLIMAGRYNSVIAGGFDYASDLPFKIHDAKSRLDHASVDSLTRMEYMQHLLSLFPSKLSYKTPQIFDFITGRTMIDECELMCRANGITRQEADEYAALSHQRASKAVSENLIQDICGIITDENEVIDSDNTIIPPDMKKLRSLKSVSTIKRMFKDEPGCHRTLHSTFSGIVSAGNSTILTDGAAASLLTSESFALDHGQQPKAFLRAYITTAHDPFRQYLLGPAYAIPKLLNKYGLTYQDIDVFEIHEAFAGQLLSVVKALNNSSFLKNSVKINEDLGIISIDDINKWGGSIAFGHPFGATGSRLINMAVNQLQHYKKKYAIVSGCASGAQSVAILLERYSESNQAI